MNDEHDPFELELYALRPRDISSGFQERIALGLTADSIAASRRKRQRRVVLLGGLLAASLLIAALWSRNSPRPMPDKIIPTPVEPRLARVQERLPTFQAYQHALNQSPEAALALMDKYAALSLTPAKPVHALPFVNADLSE
jgi:hypothetical protein